MAKFKIKKPQYPLDDQTRQIIKLTRWTSINFPTLETIPLEMMTMVSIE